MNWQSSPYVPLLLTSTAISVGVAAIVWRRRPAPGALALTLTILAAGSWSLASVFQWASADLEGQHFFFELRFAFTELLVVCFLVFAVQYVGFGERLSRRAILLISVIPIVTLISLWTNVPENAYLQGSSLVSLGTFNALAVRFGPIFWVHTIYDYALIVVSLLVLSQAFIRSPRLYRGQLAATAVAAIVPASGSFMYTSGLNPFPYLDATPFAFTFTGLVLLLGFYRFRMMDIVPAARDTVIQNMDDALLVLDPRFRVVDMNPAAERLFRTGAARAIGEPVEAILPAWTALSTQHPTMEDLREAEIVMPAPENLSGAAAEPRYMELRVTPVAERSGQSGGWMVVLRDITERKRADNALREAKETAEAASKAKGAFLATVSHELRTPLTSVIGFAKINKKRMEDVIVPVIPAGDARAGHAIHQMGENFDIIISEGERLTALINDVLDLSKIESGKMQWHVVNVSVHQIVDQATAATASLFAQKQLALIRRIEPDLPDVPGDHDRLVQVVINLLSNAVKFTTTGSVTCRVRRVDSQVVTSVIDTGIGIAATDLDKVFDEFVQVGDPLTDHPQGTGLGLPICRQIVESHGGRIWVESVPGNGSTFSFSLPLAGSPAALQTAAASAPPEAAHAQAPA